jgi:hypothetical protein
MSASVPVSAEVIGRTVQDHAAVCGLSLPVEFGADPCPCEPPPVVLDAYCPRCGDLVFTGCFRDCERVYELYALGVPVQRVRLSEPER